MYNFISIAAPRSVEQYFAQRMQEKIFLLNRRTGNTSNFWQHRVNFKEGYCYFLSVLALLGLENNDRRVCGTIDTIPRESYTVEKNYQHAWVEFTVGDKKYVYDPLVNYVVPYENWAKLCKPRGITSSLTQKELVVSHLSDKYAYKISGNIWQFKAENEGPKDETGDDRNIFKALARGNLTGTFEDEKCEVSTFIADEPLRLFF